MLLATEDVADNKAIQRAGLIVDVFYFKSKVRKDFRHAFRRPAFVKLYEFLEPSVRDLHCGRIMEK